MAQKILGAQRDFSFGEVDPALKRADDHPARKAGLRQMANARILNSGALQVRPGRRALYPITNGGTRTERFSTSAGSVFDIQFAAGRLKIINSAGATVGNFTVQGNGAALPWASSADINNIVYAILGQAIYVTFAGMRPQVVTFDGVSTWSIADYAETVSAGGQKRTPFYRLTAKNITLLPSATTGAITVQFSSPIVVAGMVGTRVRYANRQILLGTVIDASNMNATVIEPLPPSQNLTISGGVGNLNLGDVVVGGTSGALGIVASTSNAQQVIVGPGAPVINVGDPVVGATSGATGIVTAVVRGITVTISISLNTATAFVAGELMTVPAGSFVVVTAGPVSIIVQLLTNSLGFANSFIVSEHVAGPSYSATTATIASGVPKAIAVWDDEVINAYRGFPASCFVDQFRVGFCNFPAIPGGIAWSAINSPNDLYVGANPSDAMFEIAPRKVRVLYVVPGPESNEFVFCDLGLYYIPISPTNPLKPGSVQFQLLSGDGCAQVQPRISQEAILYVNAGQNSLMAVIATGAYLRPFNTKNLSDYHGHLFNSVQCIAAPSADGTFNERYVYVLNGDGTIAVGKYDPQSLATNAPVIGWGPWSGTGVVSWIAAYAADVVFTETYFGAGVVDILDDTQYIDCSLAVNAAPAAFAPPGGKGPLWFIPSQSVTLIDQVTRVMGTYQIDANGFIIPQFNGGEDLTRVSLVAGQPWTMTVEPFCPDAAPGADVGQRMKPRRIARFSAYVAHSSGFLMSRLFSGPVTPTSPVLGTIMNNTRFPAWNVDDNQTLPPPQREVVERTRPMGRAFDPRVAVIKDMPGPLQILELGMEATL